MNEAPVPSLQKNFPTWMIGSGVFLLCWITFVAYYQYKFGLDIPPSTSGDEVDYDSVAWELAHGRGFAVNTEAAEFRRPYDLAARQEERFILAPRPHWVITYRPPLYPYAMSLLNRCFGRQFWATRIMDAAFMAGTLAVIAMTVYQRYGFLSVLISVALFMVVDWRTRLYGRAILTESMSLFLTTLVCIGLLRLSSMKSASTKSLYVNSLLIGLLFGLSLLTRTMMITWVPGLFLLVLMIARRNQFPLKQGGMAAFLVCLTGGVVFLPWAIRNINVTGEMMPLGTQGQVQLSAAFGDVIWESKGVWRNLEHEGFFDKVLTEDQSPLEEELAKANYSKQKAKEWIIANPMKSFLLMPIKIWQECRSRGRSQTLLWILAVVGIIVTRKEALPWILIALFGINLIGVAATWSVEGRFLVPLLFPIHILATIGATAIASPVCNKIRPARKIQTPQVQ